jgi:hypothetical protein
MQTTELLFYYRINGENLRVERNEVAYDLEWVSSLDSGGQEQASILAERGHDGGPRSRVISQQVLNGPGAITYPQTLRGRSLRHPRA